MDEAKMKKALNDIYNCTISIKWRDFRIYDFYIKLYPMSNVELSVAVIYDSNKGFEGNLTNIIQKIDRTILEFFKKEEMK